MVYANRTSQVYGVSRILDFDSAKKTLLVGTFGGDSCAGWGSIWKLNISTQQKTEIATTQYGCSTQQPRFSKYISGKLYFVAVAPDPEGTDMYERVDVPISIYTIDPKTLERQEVATDVQQLSGLSTFPPPKFTADVTDTSNLLTDQELLFSRFTQTKNEAYGFDVHTHVLRPL